jgi:Tfp pilus assembly protein PilF
MDAVGDRAGHARSLTYLAKGYLTAGDPNRALQAIHRAWKHFEQAGSMRHFVEARLVVARAYPQLGDPMAADEVCAHLLLDLREESGTPAETCRTEIRALKEQLR